MGFFDKLKQGLNKTKTSIDDKINNVFSNFRKVDEDLLEELEEALIMSDIGMETSVQIIDNLRTRAKKEKIEDEEDIKRINATKPNFIWVGLGAPKQEKWMSAHQGKIDGLMLGVGAGFDYYAGNIKRAPQWMQKCNLEWLYRLMQDPKRLFKRYFHTNIKSPYILFDFYMYTCYHMQ